MRFPTLLRAVGDVSNTEINHELKCLKRIFNLAIEGEQLARAPKIRLLAEPPARSGFFEADEIRAVMARMPDELRPIVEFAWITGWRVGSEVLKLEWRRVDFKAGEVRLDVGTTKNGDARCRTVAMQLVGHRTEEIYDRYNITSKSDLRDAMRKLEAASAVPADVAKQA